MDNKPLEYLAEDHIKTILSHANIKFLKPNYDENGSDLVLLNPINKHLAKQVVVQSKGRNVTTSSSNVTIPSKYIVSNFICFIYLKIDDDFNNYCYVFFYDDILNWNLNVESYTLSVPKNSKNQSISIITISIQMCTYRKSKKMLSQAPILRQSYVHFETMALK